MKFVLLALLIVFVASVRAAPQSEPEDDLGFWSFFDNIFGIDSGTENLSWMEMFWMDDENPNGFQDLEAKAKQDWMNNKWQQLLYFFFVNRW